MQRRGKYVAALVLFACVTVTVKCLALQDDKPAPVKPKPWYPRQTPKIISILPPNAITVASEEAPTKPPVGVTDPALNSAPETAKPETAKIVQLSLCISFIGTVFFLMLYRRRRNDAFAVRAGANNRTVNVVNRDHWAPEETEDQRMRESIGAIINGEAANIAQYFNRNREEVHLAMKFQQHKNGKHQVGHMVKKVEQMKRHTAANTIVVAKQMGFGRGEVELAMHLHDMQQSTLQLRGAQ